MSSSSHPSSVVPVRLSARRVRTGAFESAPADHGVAAHQDAGIARVHRPRLGPGSTHPITPRYPHPEPRRPGRTPERQTLPADEVHGVAVPSAKWPPMQSNQSASTSSSSSMRPMRSPSVAAIPAFSACGFPGVAHEQIVQASAEAVRLAPHEVLSFHRWTRCRRRARARPDPPAAALRARLVERPLEERFAIERRQDDVEDHQMTAARLFTAAAQRPQGSAPWRRTTRLPPARSRRRAVEEILGDGAARSRSRPPDRRVPRSTARKRVERAIDRPRRLREKAHVLLADVRAAQELGHVNSNERPVEQEVFEARRAVIGDHHVGRREIRTDVRIRTPDVRSFPPSAASRRAGQSTPPE